jgi:hypothetical protein
MAACISMSLKPDESMVGARAAAKTDRTSTQFYRKLAEAMRHGATITEEIMINGLTDREAYRIEKQKIEQLHKQNRGQLWNSIDERFVGINREEFKQKQRGNVEAIQRRLFEEYSRKRRAKLKHV